MDSLSFAAMAIGLVCASTAMAAVYLSRHVTTPGGVNPDEYNLVMVFKNDVLIDADDAIWSVLTDMPTPPLWQDIRLALLPLLPQLPRQLGPASPEREGSGIGLTILEQGDTTRVILHPCPTTKDEWFASLHAKALAARLHAAMTRAPSPMWSLSKDAELLWCNDAFTQYAAAYGGRAAFADHIASRIGALEAGRMKRLNLTSAGLRSGQNHWIEVTDEETDSGTIYYANGVDAVVRAEAAQQNFVQTLSKTFANLTTGLAIFDRDRRLVLFNPSLVDLSGVPIEFLSARPAMFEFFDKLRDCRVMPEPKNYGGWRERMAKLVAAACDDRFRETWTLASGQTFDITGQPYPDGAIAFLFNDITAEVSLTRGFRTELDTLQSVIDMIEDSVAVFDAQGILTVCNTAYGEMWNVDPEACIPETTIVEATLSWKSAFHPSPVWPELRDFVTSSTERVSWDSELRSKDGRDAVCRIDPICHGATLIRFCYRPKHRDLQPEPEGLKIVSA